MNEATGLNDDCWYGVKDSKKRKQIQNRLAQRARRKRLTRQKHISAPSRANAQRQNEDLETKVHCTDFLEITRPPKKPVLSFGLLRNPVPSVNAASTTEDEVKLDVLNQTRLRPPTLSVYAALFDNGVILGLTCGKTIESLSKPPSAHTPSTLCPTTLQLTTVHAQWVDRFPFPQMRDNCIKLLDSGEGEQFLGDLFRMESFVVDEGRPTWEPSAWRIGREFSQKWGFLFDCSSI